MFLWVVNFLVASFCVIDCHFLSEYTYTQPPVSFAERNNLSSRTDQVRLSPLWKTRSTCQLHLHPKLLVVLDNLVIIHSLLYTYKQKYFRVLRSVKIEAKYARRFLKINVTEIMNLRI
jgi:hypothetical protein